MRWKTWILQVSGVLSVTRPSSIPRGRTSFPSPAPLQRAQSRRIPLLFGSMEGKPAFAQPSPNPLPRGEGELDWKLLREYLLSHHSHTLYDFCDVFFLFFFLSLFLFH